MAHQMQENGILNRLDVLHYNMKIPPPLYPPAVARPQRNPAQCRIQPQGNPPQCRVEPQMKPAAIARPFANSPALARPVANLPALARPVANLPAVARPVANPPALARPVANLPAVARPVANPPAVGRPVANAAVVVRPQANPAKIQLPKKPVAGAQQPANQVPYGRDHQEQYKNPAAGQLADPRYKLIKKLGSGTFGLVFQVEDTKKGENYALKLIKNSHDAVGLLKREASILIKLSHPNIVKIYYAEFLDRRSNPTFNINESWGVSLPACIFVLELCGVDLQSKLHHRTEINDFWNRKIFQQLVMGVGYLHANNIIHRDLKPANILLRGNTVKISDFGLAKCGIFTHAIHQTIVGTPAYMAPEAITGRYDNTVDVYSLGIVLIECYTPKETFRPLLQQILAGKKNVSLLLNPLPRSIKSLASSMISEPNKRPSCQKIISSF